MTDILLKAGSASKYFISEILANPTVSPQCLALSKPYIVIAGEEFDTRALAEVFAAINAANRDGFSLFRKKFSAQECEIGLFNLFSVDEGKRYSLPGFKHPLIIIASNINKKSKVLMKMLMVRGMSIMAIQSDELSALAEVKQASKHTAIEEKRSYSIYGPVDFTAFVGIRKTVFSSQRPESMMNYFPNAPEDIASLKEELFFEGLRKEVS